MKNNYYIVCHFFLFLILLQGISFADQSCRIIPENKFYLTGDTFKIEYLISKDVPSTEFRLANVENKRIQGLTLIDSKIDVITGNHKSTFTEYKITFLYRAEILGEITLEKIKLKFEDSGGLEEVFFTPVYTINVVNWFKKYKVQFWFFALIVFLTCAVFYIVRKQRIVKKERLLIEKQNEFNLLKKNNEQKALKRIRESSKYIIAGEYSSYSKYLISILNEYFMECHTELNLQNDFFEIKEKLKPFFDKHMQNKLNQFIELSEEVQFANKIPLQSDLDRLQVLLKELLVNHKDFYKQDFKRSIV